MTGLGRIHSRRARAVQRQDYKIRQDSQGLDMLRMRMTYAFCAAGIPTAQSILSNHVILSRPGAQGPLGNIVSGFLPSGFSNNSERPQSVFASAR